MVTKICKDIKNLQVVSTIMTNGVGQVTRRKDRESITVKYPKEIISYQQHIGGGDCGYQHRVMGTGLANVAHFKSVTRNIFWDLLYLVSYRDSQHETWQRTVHRDQEEAGS